MVFFQKSLFICHFKETSFKTVVLHMYWITVHLISGGVAGVAEMIQGKYITSLSSLLGG